MNEITLVNNTSLAVKEYNGQRVVTFKDIDDIHKKKRETANTNFRRNKDKFTEGVDYYKIPKNELPDILQGNSKVGNPTFLVTLLTYSGYLMIVKTFTDKLSWQIQRQLVDNYFNPQPPEQPKAEMTATELPLELQMIDKLMQYAKMTHNKMSEHESRVKALEEQKPREIIIESDQVTYLTPDEATENLFVSPKTLYTATSIGKVFGLNARELNRFLFTHGVQVNDGVGWKLTKRYEGLGYQYTKKAHFDNRETEVLMNWWTIKGKDFICSLLKNKGLKQKGVPQKYNRHGHKGRTKRK